ncbi:jg14689, partial [Pararge aegeria aegeria]
MAAIGASPDEGSGDRCACYILEDPFGQGIGVELVRALDSHPPNLSNVFCECDTK